MDDHPSPAPPGWLPPTPAPVAEPALAAQAAAPAPNQAFGEQRESLLRRIWGAVVVGFFAVLKFGKAALLLLPKLKVLTTSGTMLVSVAAYSVIWGWRFAVGFVVLLLVHEYGHVIALRREGIEASAPVFIPFMGALIWAKSLGGNALAEARVGLAGPVLGSIGAALCIPLAAVTGNDLFTALAFTGFFLNLFNLLPFGFLDGARAAAAMSPWMWAFGLVGMIALVLIFPNPIILIIAILGALETYRRFKSLRAGGEEVQDYYRVSKRNRLLVTAVYLGLIALLVVGMDATHIQRTFSDA